MKTWRLIVSGAGPASENMAIDEALLEHFIKEKNDPVLRIYGWSPAAISFGYFQHGKYIVSQDCLKKKQLDFVRRITGGEAILHDDEVTYSVICRQSDMDIKGTVKETFKCLTKFLLRAYNMIGLRDVRFCGKKNVNERTDFCFSVMRELDIICNGKKIGGNAQKRVKDVVFQHGSIPITFNAEKVDSFFKEGINKKNKSIASLSEMTDKLPEKEHLVKILANAFRATFKVDLKSVCLSESEKNTALRLKKEKYENDDWNFNTGNYNNKGLLINGKC